MDGDFEAICFGSKGTSKPEVWTCGAPNGRRESMEMDTVGEHRAMEDAGVGKGRLWPFFSTTPDNLNTSLLDFR